MLVAYHEDERFNTSIPVKAISLWPNHETLEIKQLPYQKQSPGQPLQIQFRPIINGSNWKKQWVKIVATNDTASVADSFCYTVITPPQIADLPAGVVDGINYIDSTKVVLSFYAPEKTIALSSVISTLAGRSTHYMKLTPDSKRFWTLKLSNLVPVMNTFPIPGWCSLHIADPIVIKSVIRMISTLPLNLPRSSPLSFRQNQGNCILSSNRTNSLCLEWKSIYPPLPWPILPSTNSWSGFYEKHDYPTLIDTLNYLKNLGINAIELMPVMEFEGNSSWGYNPDFMFAPDKYYGTKNGLEKFIEAAHSKGIAVILDIVLNHQFGKSPLVRLYWDQTANTVAQ